MFLDFKFCAKFAIINVEILKLKLKGRGGFIVEILSILLSLELFVIAGLVIFLIVRSKGNKSSNEDQNSKSYNDGFNDGYQNLSKKIQNELNVESTITKVRLLEIIGDVPVQSNIKEKTEIKKAAPVKQTKVTQKTK